MQALGIVLLFAILFLIWPPLLLLSVPLGFWDGHFKSIERFLIFVFSACSLVVEMLGIWLLVGEHIWYRTTAWVMNPGWAIAIVIVYVVLTVIAFIIAVAGGLSELDEEDTGALA
jgi:hypothetical protein